MPEDLFALFAHFIYVKAVNGEITVECALCSFDDYRFAYGTDEIGADSWTSHAWTHINKHHAEDLPATLPTPLSLSTPQEIETFLAS